MKTTLKINAAGLDPHILRVFGNDGTTYHYGTFPSRADAIEFGKSECQGFNFEATRLIVLERGEARIRESRNGANRSQRPTAA
jgi:hypothetical protein